MIENYNRSLKLKNNLINAEQRNSNLYYDANRPSFTGDKLESVRYSNVTRNILETK
jgi:hypothetical protein